MTLIDEGEDIFTVFPRSIPREDGLLRAQGVDSGARGYEKDV